jgi:hypothetical protein
MSGTPLTQRRRLSTHLPNNDDGKPNWSEMYTMDTLSGKHQFIYVRIFRTSFGKDAEDYDACADAAGGIGHLSLDENQEVCLRMQNFFSASIVTSLY